MTPAKFAWSTKKVGAAKIMDIGFSVFSLLILFRLILIIGLNITSQNSVMSETFLGLILLLLLGSFVIKVMTILISTGSFTSTKNFATVTNKKIQQRSFFSVTFLVSIDGQDIVFPEAVFNEVQEGDKVDVEYHPFLFSLLELKVYAHQ